MIDVYAPLLFCFLVCWLAGHPAPPWCDINIAAQDFVSQGTRVSSWGVITCLGANGVGGPLVLCNNRGIGNHILHANVTYGGCPLGGQVSVKHKPLIDLETPSHNVLHASREAAAVGCITKVRYSDLVGNDGIKFNTAISVSGTGQSLVKNNKEQSKQWYQNHIP